MKTVLVAGGSGLIGRHLVPALENAGYLVTVLSRKPVNQNEISWKFDGHTPSDFDVIINLCGAGIADNKWTAARKAEIIESRIKPLEKLSFFKPKLLISASGTGFYGGHNAKENLTENDLPGIDFLAEVCSQWEKSTQNITAERTVILRIGPVLTTKGGFLAKFLFPSKFGLGVVLGSGKQYLSWIHIDDLCTQVLQCMANESINGVHNLVSSEPCTAHDFQKQLSKTVRKPYFLPNVPGFIIKLIFGEMATMLLGSNHVKRSEAFAKHTFCQLDIALEDLL